MEGKVAILGGFFDVVVGRRRRIRRMHGNDVESLSRRDRRKQIRFPNLNHPSKLVQRSILGGSGHRHRILGHGHYSASAAIGAIIAITSDPV